MHSRTSLILSFITALIVANVSGPQYIYPAFGTSLTTRFGWTAVENSLVSTASFLGMSFSGPLCARMVDRLGISRTLVVSACLCFIGPFLLAQTYAGYLPQHVGLCALYLMSTGVGGAAAYLCALDSQSHHFASHRGMSMGLTSASIGLCGLVFSQMNDLFFLHPEDPNDNNTYGFLLFMAVAMSGGMLLGAFFLGDIDHSLHQESPHVETRSDSVVVSTETSPLLPTQPTTQPTTPSTQLTYTGIDFFLHPVGFSLFFTLFIILGFGYVYLASIGPMLLALPSDPVSGPQHLRNVHVSLFSIANCGSRAIFGTLSDVMKRRFGVHRLWVFWMASIGSTLTFMFLVFEVSNANDMFYSTIFMAIIYGAVFGVAPAATTEFGIQVFVHNWGWLLYSPAFGSQLFNILFGILYDNQAKDQGTQICKGVVCFQGTFSVGIVCSIICTSILSLAIARQKLYRCAL
ncbi:major facilitator superfamily domain-containing protein [Spinellus fusiger]|nr:major facilitator superfamily domain-containing protein [Spinellus fusiger]